MVSFMVIQMMTQILHSNITQAHIIFQAQVQYLHIFYNFMTKGNKVSSIYLSRLLLVANNRLGLGLSQGIFDCDENIQLLI